MIRPRLFPISILAFTALVTFSFGHHPARAQDEKDDSAPVDDAPPAVIRAIQPLFDQLIEANSTRATVELSADTVIDGAVVGSEKSVYQIASVAPNQFTVYLKSQKQQTRIYCDGESATIAFSPTKYTELDGPLSIGQAVVELPVAMGPYPEVVLALTLAGNDPTFTLTTGMKSLEVVDRKPFRGETPSVHMRGVQDDDVKWDLWITQDAKPVPLRLLVDLTDMLRANGDLDLPPTYRYLLRFDFKHWLINHKNAEAIFKYAATPQSEKFDSVEAYLNAQKQ